MEPLSIQRPSTSDTDATVQDQDMAVLDQDMAVEESPIQPQPPEAAQAVSAAEVKELYQKFRRAALESTARELRRQQDQRVRDQVEILNIAIDNISVSDFLAQLQQGVVFTPNVDHLMKLQKDEDFVKAYDKADFRVCDSQVLLMASKFLGRPIQAKISGSDLFPLFCEHHRHNENIKIFLLGGAEGVAAQAQTRINDRIGREIIVQSHSPSFGFEKNEDECQRILDMIRQSPANVLVVGVGAPKQEKWIAKYKDQLPSIDIFMAVGAAIDFEAGNKPRAPELISKLGLEWLYRLASEPKRLWKRYLLDDFPFLWLIFKERLSQLRRPQNP